MDLESSSPFNEKWKSTKGAGGGGGRVKENDVLLLAGFWYEIFLILHQIFWKEAKLIEAFLLGDDFMELDIEKSIFKGFFLFLR